MLVIPNYSLDGLWNDSLVFRVGNATDGVLAESGFTGGGPGKDKPYDYVGDQWVQRVKFMRNLQAHGKAAYYINEYGDVHNPSKWKEPCSEDPLNCIQKPVRQWVLGSYLMGKEQAAALYLSKVQGYGNWSYYPEWSAPVGKSLGAPVEHASGLWSRLFSGAFVLVNPSNVTIDATVPAGKWQDLYGKQVSSTLAMAPVTAATLVRANFTRAEKGAAFKKKTIIKTDSLL